MMKPTDAILALASKNIKNLVENLKILTSHQKFVNFINIFLVKNLCHMVGWIVFAVLTDLEQLLIQH